MILAWAATAATGLVTGTAAAVAATALTAATLAAALLGGLIGTGDDGGVVKSFEPELGNLGADEALDVADVGGVFRRDERDGVADGLRATGAADAVHVVFWFLRDVVVDDVGDAGDVDTAGRDIGGDHDFVLAGLKAFEGLDALILGAVGVEDGDGVIGGFEAAGDFIGAVFGARKHDHTVELGLSEQRFEEFKFLVVSHGIERVVNGFVDRASDADLDFGRIAQGKRGDGRDLGRNGRGEEQRLALARTAGDDVFDGGQKTHVEHAVHFVEDQDVDVAQADLAGLQVIDEAAGRGDDDVDAAFELGALHAVADAAEDGDRADIGKTGEVAERGFDLSGEFARRLEDEHASAAVRTEAREDGQGEGRRFAGTGLGRGDEIAAAEDDGDGAKLNRSRIRVTSGLDAAEDLLREIE